MCRNPYIAAGGAAYGCGQCLPCRVNHRRTWTHRITLEASQYKDNSFWTVTYSDDKLPVTDTGQPTLNPKDFTDFLKRLRYYHAPRQLRYYAVGEYGEKTSRPHYHFIGFNFPHCLRGTTVTKRRGTCCDVCSAVESIWGLGAVYSGQVTPASAAYVCGYITKRMTSKKDERLCGRYPEFARMSLRPGIGAGIIADVASALLTHNLETTQEDVPTSLRTGTRVQPLGRYLTRQLRSNVGKAPNAPLSTLQAQRDRLQDLRTLARETAPKGTYSETFKSLILQKNEGKYQRLKAKSKIYKKRDSLE